MFDSNHYVPILKGKEGEFKAIANLSDITKSLITPLIDIPRRTKNQEAKISIERFLEKKAIKIAKSWGAKSKIFIDLSTIDPDTQTNDNQHPLVILFNKLRNEKVKAIPTIGYENDLEQISAVKGIVAKDKRGLLVRLSYEEIVDDIEDIDKGLKEIISQVNTSPSATNLLLDIGSIEGKDIGVLSLQIQTFINKLPNIQLWNTLTVASSAIPRELYKVVAKDSVEILPRNDYALWMSIINSSNNLNRHPSYGDYSIVHPNFPEIDYPIQPSPKIRYTTKNGWIIMKGHSPKKTPSRRQYPYLSKMLERRDEYLGSNYSWGDEYISKCGVGNNGPGNSATWVSVDTNHHITLTVNQLAN